MPLLSRETVAPWIGWLALAMALITLVNGLWQVLLPLSFYHDFPGFGHQWVALLPPYNEHLVRDVGEGNLALGILFFWAAASRDARLLRATSVVWIVAASIHFVYHLVNLASFDLFDQVLQMLALGGVLLLPSLILVGLTRSARGA